MGGRFRRPLRGLRRFARRYPRVRFAHPGLLSVAPSGLCLGQGQCEAIYVQDLIIEAGATLNTNGCPVYYSTLTLNGAVDNPANLIEIVPPCPADVNGDGFVNVLDLVQLLLCFGDPATPPCDTGQDINQDGFVNVNDLIAVLLSFDDVCP